MPTLIVCGAIIICSLAFILPFFFYIVPQQEACIIQRLGKFHSVTFAGLQAKIPLIDEIVHTQTLRTDQTDLKIETKTKDNVFVDLHIAVQTEVKPDAQKVATAFYKLTNPKQQISSYVFDIVRAHVPKMTLDEIFEKKDEVANEVKEGLAKQMEVFGYEIMGVLVVAINPDSKVVAAMNEINTAQRLRAAANERAEADKIILVKKAEAEAESKILQGKGIAGQREAIIDGLKRSVAEFKESVPGSSASDVMSMVLMTQYFDTLKEVGGDGKVLLVPHSPSAVADIGHQIRESMLSVALTKE